MSIYSVNMRLLMGGSGTGKTRKQLKAEKKRLDSLWQLPTVKECMGRKKMKKKKAWKPGKSSHIRFGKASPRP